MRDMRGLVVLGAGDWSTTSGKIAVMRKYVNESER